MSVGPMQLLIILLIIVLLFGTKKLRSLGSDLGMGIKNFKDHLNVPTPPESKPDSEQVTTTKQAETSKVADDQPRER